MRNRARWIFAASVAATAALYAIPQAAPVAWPLILLSTLAHELGHGLVALLTGGDFHQLRVWADGSGVASWGGDGGRIQNALVAAGGLVGPAIAAALCLRSGSRPRGARTCLGALGAGLLFLAALRVRNTFGLFFVGGTGLLSVAIAARAPIGVVQGVLVLAAVQLGLSVFSRADYLFTDVAVTSGGTMPSDVARMAEALFLPYWFWGGVCAVFSAGALLGGMKAFLRATRDR